ncbi:MAG: hypothetical protein FJ296_03785 [Planctomycetes bacterium]|nr:hypothetical protein [Planctomycetota bacterium]
MHLAILCLSLALTGSCLANGAPAAPSGGGPAPGSDVPTFVGIHVGGSHDGRRACPVCVHGNKPSVAVWARTAALEQGLATVAALDEVLRGWPAWQATGYLVLLPESGEDEATLRRDVAEARDRLGLERAFAVLVDSRTDGAEVARYAIPPADEAATTAIVYVNRRVERVFRDLGADEPARARLRDALAPLFAREAPYREGAVPLCGDDEPGQRLGFWGRVLDHRGQPLEDAAVIAWQTDVTGLYVPRGQAGRNPRLRAAAVTDAGGWFRFSSVVPGPYPGSDEPGECTSACWRRSTACAG